MNESSQSSPYLSDCTINGLQKRIMALESRRLELYRQVESLKELCSLAVRYFDIEESCGRNVPAWVDRMRELEP